MPKHSTAQIFLMARIHAAADATQSSPDVKADLRGPGQFSSNSIDRGMNFRHAHRVLLYPRRVDIDNEVKSHNEVTLLAACTTRVRGVSVMKPLSVIGLMFVAAIFATVPISPQVTPRGIEVSVGQAQAQVTYGQARRVARRADRRADRYDRRAGYGVAAGGAYLAASGGPRSLGVVVAPGRSATVIDPATGRRCTIEPSGWHWCWKP
jgi:hypothetical protein